MNTMQVVKNKNGQKPQSQAKKNKLPDRLGTKKHRTRNKQHAEKAMLLEIKRVQKIS